MLIKIFRVSNLIFLNICIISFTLFSGISVAQAAQMSTDINDNNLMDIVIEEKSGSLNLSKNSVEPDLGDDQAFPFIPGFGKNSGKDWSTDAITVMTEK